MALNWFKVSVFSFGFFLVLSYAISPTYSSSDKSGESKEELVVSLDHFNLTDYLAKNNYIVVKFYASWCDSCKRFAPEFEKAAAILSKEDPSVVFAQIDGSEVRNSILVRADLHPTIKIVKNGGDVIHKYNGPLEADAIVAFVKKERGPATVELQSAEEVDRLVVGDKKTVIVGIFPEFSGEEYENFTALAERLRSKYEYELRYTSSDAKLLPVTVTVTGPVVRMFKPFDEPSLDFQEFDVDSLEKHIEESSAATVSFHDHDSKNRPYIVKFFSSDDSKAILFINSSEEQQIDNLKAKFHEVAKEHKGKGIRFAILDLDANRGDIQFEGPSYDHLPLNKPLIMITTIDGKDYLKPNVEPEQISAWVMDFMEGKLKTYRMSEPIPESNDAPVKVIVADTLDDLVLKSPKNVLLELYAPRCGFCNMLAPILDKIAVSFAKNADVMIAKIDATANDIAEDGFEVKGYPTLYFKSASGKIFSYRGIWTEEDIISFIDKARDEATWPYSEKAEL